MAQKKQKKKQISQYSYSVPSLTGGGEQEEEEEIERFKTAAAHLYEHL